MADKKTKREWYEVLEAIVRKSKNPQKAGALDFIAHEVELLDKKSGKSKTSKTAKTNDKIKYAILDVLAESEKPMTVSEMMLDTRLATWNDGDTKKVMSNQKLSSMVRQLVKEELVVRTEDKKKALFSLPADDIEEDEASQTEEEKEKTKEKVEVEPTAENEDEVDIDNYFEYVVADVLPEPSEDDFRANVIITDEYVEYQMVA